MENTVTVSWKTLDNLYGMAAAYLAVSAGMSVTMTETMLSLANLPLNKQTVTMDAVRALLNESRPKSVAALP